jgi:signal transduction histidine kinase
MTESDAPSDDRIVSGDAAGLRAMVSNLVDNAVRYTPAGGQVDVSVSRDGDDVLLAVRDTGPGVPPRERQRVFDRFYRVPDAVTASAPGSGLGLAIVKRVAERHDATIALGTGLAGPQSEGLGVTVRIPGQALERMQAPNARNVP